MATYLEVINDARNEAGLSDLSLGAAQGTSGDALESRRALNRALADIFRQSPDADWADVYTTLTTTPSVSVLSSPVVTWNPQMIRAVKYVKSPTLLYDLTLVPVERAKEIESVITFANNDPAYWYVNQGNVYIVPTPTAAYTLQTYYQKVLQKITVSTINSTIDMPSEFIAVLTDGVFAYLRKAAGDPEWASLKAQFLDDLKIVFQRNKYNLKQNGWRRVRFRTSGDFGL